MSRLMSALAVAGALSAGACGGGGASINPPPPTGKYSLASLNGTYAFVTTGEAISGSTAVPLSRVGSFAADGNGHITGGIEDVNNFGTPSTAIAITGGSYTVSANGRGRLTLNFPSGNSTNFGIILTSTNDGLMIDETLSSNQASTGSGNFMLQQSTPFALSQLSGTYVFDFTGFDGAQPNPNPESFIGEFVADGGTGTIPSGLFDDNDGGQLTADAAMSPGSIAQDPSQPSAFTSFGRGIATVAGQNFVFYIVNANRIRFLSTTNGMLSGDAELQANNVPPPMTAISSSFAFLVSGSSANGGLIRVGRLTSNGTTLSNIVMDVNSGGSETEPSISSANTSVTYDSTTGRGTLSFQSSVASVYSFVFYLSSANGGVIQEVSGPSGTNTAVVVDDGSILAQSPGPFSSSNLSGPYAMNWSGLVTASSLGTDEEDLLSQVTVSNLNLSGASEIFQFTGVSLSHDVGTGGQIMLNGDGTKNNTMNVNLSGPQVDMVVYIVSPQLAFFANRDNNGTTRIVAGILEAQQ